MESGDDSVDRNVPASVAVSVELDGETFNINVPLGTTVMEVADVVLRRRRSPKAGKRVLVHNGRILTRGTLAENGIESSASVRLELERKLFVSFTYHPQQNRKRIFTLLLENTKTVKEVKAALTLKMSKGYPPIDMSDKIVRISKDWSELSDDSFPALSDELAYSVHVIPRKENWMPLRVNYKSSSSDDLDKKFLVFAPHQSTTDRLKEEIAKVASCAPECIEIKLPLAIEKDDVYQSDDDDDDSGVDSDEEDEANEVPRVLDEAKFGKHAETLHDCHLVEARASSLMKISVPVYTDASSEVTELQLDVYEHYNMKTVLHSLAKEMGGNLNCMRLYHEKQMVQPEKTVRDYNLHDGAMFTACIFTRGAVIHVHHSQGIFEYHLFVLDTALVTSAQLQHFVESKHKFCPNSVDLYHGDVMVTAESSLQATGIGMNDTLVVHTKVPENVSNHCKKQRGSAPRIVELDSEIPYESCPTPQRFKGSRSEHSKASSREKLESRERISKSKTQHRSSVRKKKQKTDGVSLDQLAGDRNPAETHKKPTRATGAGPQSPAARGSRAEETPASCVQRLSKIHQTESRENRDEYNFLHDENVVGDSRDDENEVGDVVVQRVHGDDANSGERESHSLGQSVPAPQGTTPTAECYNFCIPVLRESTHHPGPHMSNHQEVDKLDCANVETVITTKTYQKGGQTVAHALTAIAINSAFANDPNVSRFFSAPEHQASPALSALEDPPGVIKDAVLREIAEKLSLDWTSLCLSLGVRANDITRIKCDNISLLDQAYEGLRQWKKIKGREATLSELKKALKKNELNLIADMLHEEAEEK